MRHGRTLCRPTCRSDVCMDSYLLHARTRPPSSRFTVTLSRPSRSFCIASVLYSIATRFSPCLGSRVVWLLYILTNCFSLSASPFVPAFLFERLRVSTGRRRTRAFACPPREGRLRFFASSPPCAMFARLPARSLVLTQPYSTSSFVPPPHPNPARRYNTPLLGRISPSTPLPLDLFRVQVGHRVHPVHSNRDCARASRRGT